MACRPAPACRALLDQANARWPARSRASDGICASAQHHRQNPTSDHEPDVRGIAHAVDLTHDPAHGVDCGLIVDDLVATRDPRVKYVIYAGRIWRSYKTSPRHPQAWTPQPYHGSNPHTKHMHVSIWTEYEHDVRPWFEADTTSEDDMTPEQDERLRAVEAKLDKVLNALAGYGTTEKGAREDGMAAPKRLSTVGNIAEAVGVDR